MFASFSKSILIGRTGNVSARDTYQTGEHSPQLFDQNIFRGKFSTVNLKVMKEHDCFFCGTSIA